MDVLLEFQALTLWSCKPSKFSISLCCYFTTEMKQGKEMRSTSMWGDEGEDGERAPWMQGSLRINGKSQSAASFTKESALKRTWRQGTPGRINIVWWFLGECLILLGHILRLKWGLRNEVMVMRKNKIVEPWLSPCKEQASVLGDTAQYKTITLITVSFWVFTPKSPCPSTPGRDTRGTLVVKTSP